MGKRAGTGSSDVSTYVDRFDDSQAAALTAVHAAFGRLLPGATEELSWGMPTFRIGPDIVVSYAGFAKHNSLFPGPETTAIIAEEFPGITTTKGTIHFDRNRAPATGLLRRLVTLRIQQINDSYPRSNGVTRRYFGNGFTEYTGKIRNDHMHGAWQWFRKNGTIKRSGSFREGTQVGEWITYDASGNPYRTTDFGR
jgi:uncharacterized protein YdhG (YjbR/CyaY superfamily)